MIRRSHLFLASLAVMMGSAGAASAARVDFFRAALCQPTWTADSIRAVNGAAAKVATPTFSGSMVLFHLPKPISRDGFTTQDVMLGSHLNGVLIDGKVAADLARRYDLEPENAGGVGFARQLPDSQQKWKDQGLAFIVAREREEGNTLLACEFVANDELEIREDVQRARSENEKTSDP